ncbi:MAG: hypothetical protein HY532_07655 [Chloroflexi bacterium]|nr:hypothetical protein [Chloroflexota bacterium]
MHSIARHTLTLAFMVLTALVAGGCQGLGEWLVGQGEPLTAVSTPTPSPTPPPSEPVLSYLGVVIKEGRPFYQEVTSFGPLQYEPWVEYTTVQQIKDTLAATQQVLASGLGISDLPPIAISITWDSEFIRAAGQSQFQHPTWLAGFAAYGLANGQVVNARIYVNAQAEGITHNTAHELTHIAAPTLPQWLAEGIAEYVAYRVDLLVEPGAGERRMLQARGLVRKAQEQERLLTIEALHDLIWEAPPDYSTLELAYAQSWLLVEHLAAAHDSTVLGRLVDDYARDPATTLATFEAAIGTPATDLWEHFAVNALAELIPEEQVGQSLCALANLQSEEGALTQEWNQFLQDTGPVTRNQLTQRFLKFTQAWGSILAEVSVLPAPSDAAPIKERMMDYVALLQEAMLLLAQGRETQANVNLTAANVGRATTHQMLGEALQARASWLKCAA